MFKLPKLPQPPDPREFLPPLPWERRESTSEPQTPQSGPGSPAPSTSSPHVTTAETLTYQNRELAKSLLVLEVHLSQKCRIAGKPCDCCGGKHPLELEKLSEEALSMSGDPLYKDVIALAREVERKANIPAIASGAYDAEYPDLAQRARSLRKTLMGTESLGSLLGPEEREAVRERVEYLLGGQSEGNPTSVAKEPWQMTRAEFEQQPSTLFHGTRTDIGVGAEFGGIHVGTRKAALARLEQTPSLRVGGRPGAERIIPLRAELRNPLGSIQNPISETDLFAIVNSPKRLATIKSQGYDGIIYRNISEDPGSVSLLVFERSAIKTHQAEVVRALSEGKPVPAEVLRDYPDLAKSA